MSNPTKPERQFSLVPPKKRFLAGDKARLDKFANITQDPDFQVFLNEALCQFVAYLPEGRTLEEKAGMNDRRLGAKDFANMLVKFPFQDVEAPNGQRSDNLIHTPAKY
jgi:hypothetical protein